MKKLFRIKGQNSMLGGVLTGMAEYFNVDVTVLRVITVGLFFTPAPVVIGYLILWAVMPLKQENFVQVV